MKKYIIGIFLYCWSFTLRSQIQEPDLQYLIDDLLPSEMEILSYEEVMENLLILKSNPIDLNKSTKADLEQLFFLNENQVDDIIRRKENSGNIISIYELQAIPSLDPLTIRKILPFIQIKDPGIFSDINKKILKTSQTYFLTRIEQIEEKNSASEDLKVPQTKYLGSPQKILIRLRSCQRNKYSYGFTLEKDAGEKLKWTKQQAYFDFFSFHVQIQNQGRLKNLIIGDYQLQVGQGLVFASSLGIGRGGETINSTKRICLSGRPYTSSNENQYLRGMLTTYQIHPKLDITTFYSYTHRDAEYQYGITTPYITSLSMSGLHRNDKELRLRKTTKEIDYGSLIHYHTPTTNLGLVFHHIKFEVPIIPVSRIYNAFHFSGKHLSTLSAFFSHRLHNTSFFGEVAKNNTGGTGSQLGILTALTSKIDLACSYRNYTHDFHSFYGNALGQSTHNQNEQGFYWGLKMHINSKLTCQMFIDIFHFPWIRYRSYQPSNGWEWLARADYEINDNTHLYFQTRSRAMHRNVDNNNTNYQAQAFYKMNFLTNLDIHPSPAWRLKTRIQFSNFAHAGTFTKGLLILQDVGWKKGKFSVQARYALFDTDDYDNRQYAYERDLWLSFSIPALQGVGNRKYLLVEYQLARSTELGLRYSKTSYTNPKEIGYGLNRINGNIKNDVKFQLTIKF